MAEWNYDMTKKHYDMTKKQKEEEAKEAAFIKFRDENPRVMANLIAMTRRAKLAGHNRVGIGMLFEVLRWDQMMATRRSEDDFKLNNNFRSYYVREIEERCPDLVGMFEKRRSAADKE